jgi:hypothetical protein
MCQHREDCSGDPRRLDAVIAPPLLLDAGQNLLFLAYAQRVLPVKLASAIAATVMTAGPQTQRRSRLVPFDMYLAPLGCKAVTA